MGMGQDMEIWGGGWSLLYQTCSKGGRLKGVNKRLNFILNGDCKLNIFVRNFLQ